MRYTTKRNGKNVIPLLNAVCGIVDRADALHSYLYGDAVDKLAAYEDTGLTPEEFHESVAFVLELNKKLKPYMDAEKNGLLVRLPCKVGDVLYAPARSLVYELRVTQFDFGGYEESYLWVEWNVTKGITENYRIRASEIGKTVFLSRTEAESAMKGENKDV